MRKPKGVPSWDDPNPAPILGKPEVPPLSDEEVEWLEQVHEKYRPRWSWSRLITRMITCVGL